MRLFDLDPNTLADWKVKRRAERERGGIGRHGVADRRPSAYLCEAARDGR